MIIRPVTVHEHLWKRRPNGGTIRTMSINVKSIKNITLKTNDMQTNIIELISNSCGCSQTEAQEYLDSEIRNLRELQEMDDLRDDDIENACLDLGLDLDYQEYFINRLAEA